MIRYGRLVIVGPPSRSYTGFGRHVSVRCDCGVVRDAPLRAMKAGTLKSCGCLRGAVTAERNRRHATAGGEAVRRTPEYRSWSGMLERCNNPNSRDFPNYGARGIVVCERWRDFKLFLLDMGRKPSPDHSIDRIDNSLGYEPSNCRWATHGEQARNRRGNRLNSEAAKVLRHLWPISSPARRRALMGLFGISQATLSVVGRGLSWGGR
ncbi:MAG TPA: hypothetical protein VJ725_21525 [Thermoanaerobaculia bacterium]|nr:hypothetical protein [Thermoanaerobaculia bacterium]